MNLVLWSKGSSGAVPFSTLVALLALWFCVSVPLTFVGAYLGFRKRVSHFAHKFHGLFHSFCRLKLIFDSFSRHLSAIGTSRANQSNSTSNSRPIDLHTADTRYHNGRCPTIWVHFHPIVLHFEFAVVQPNVLHVRFLVSGILDPSDHLLRNNNPSVLLPSLRRRLPLVVAIVFNIWLYSILSVYLLLPLFCNQTVNRRHSINIFVLWLHTDYCIFVFPNDRFHRLYGLFLVHTKNLQCRQS